MKVSVDRPLCSGHARCYAVDPEFFTLDDDGYSSLGENKPVPAGREELVRRGVSACPELALRIHD